MTFNEMVLACEAADASFDATFEKCIAFAEASYNEYKTNIKEAELKVVKESGTSEDLIYLEDAASEILKVNHRRWEIEECFKIMKSVFKSRPVYLSRDDRIKAHFTTCFLSLVIYRYLEKNLENRFTCEDIITTLKDMNFYEIEGEGYIPTYTRTDLTDALHEAFGFRTDYQIVTTKQMKKIFGTLYI